jgi:hypothetical protein
MSNRPDDVDALIARQEGRSSVPTGTRRAANGSGDASLPEAHLPDHENLLERWIALRLALKEAQHLGLKVRISGAGVVFSGDDILPHALRDHLHRERHLLWCYLGAEDIDLATLEFVDALEVEPVLVETAEEVKAAVAREQGGPLAIDIETAPRPGQGTPRHRR